MDRKTIYRWENNRIPDRITLVGLCLTFGLADIWCLRFMKSARESMEMDQPADFFVLEFLRVYQGCSWLETREIFEKNYF